MATRSASRSWMRPSTSTRSGPGNALDRLRHPEGVVDFLSVGLGAHRLPTFNLADVAVVGGAMLLVGSLVREYARRS